METPRRRIDAVGVVICTILGAALAFAAAVFDGVMSFGGSNTRFVVVFLICWPLGALLSYVAVKDMQEKWHRLRNPSQEARSSIDPRVIVIWVVAVVILGLLYLIFGDFSLTP